MPNPPKIVEDFFHWFCHIKHIEGLEGDLYEEFQYRAEEKGELYAKLHYMLDVASLIRPSVSKSFLSNKSVMNLSMLSNYIKTSIRFGRKRAWFTGINIVGLTLGITSLLMIILYVQDELKYDSHISNADRKFRVYNVRHGDDGEINHYPIVPPVFAPILKDNFDQIEKAGRVMYDYGGTIFTVDENAYAEKNGVYVEKDAFEILDIQLVAGDTTGFQEPYKAIISEDLFLKFFW